MVSSLPPNQEGQTSDAGALLGREIEELVAGRSSKRSLQHCLQAIKKVEKTGDKQKIGWAVFELAMEMRAQGQYANTIQVLEKTRAIFESIGDDVGLASTFEELSYSSRELSRNALALEYSHHAISLLEKLDREEELGHAYNNLAYVYFYVNRRPESLTYAKKAKAIFKKFKAEKSLAWNACHLAMIYLEMEFFDEAEKNYSEAISKFTKLNIRQGLAWSLLGLSTVHRAQCRFQSAIQILQKANEIDKETMPKDYSGWILLNEAAIARSLGDDESSISLNKSAVNVFSSIKNQVGVGWGLFQVGQLLRDRGYLVKSWQSLGRSLDLFRDVTNKKAIGWTENEWGVTHLELNNLSHARDCFIKASVCAEQLDLSSMRGEVCKNFGNFHIDEGRINKSSEMIDKGFAAAAKLSVWESTPDLYLTQARNQIVRGDFQSARKSVDEAEKYAYKYGLLRYKPVFGVYIGEILYEQGDVTGAIRSWMNVLDLANTHHQIKPRTEALLGLIQAQWREKSSAELSSMMIQIEKDLRLGGSRKIRSKYFVIKSLISYFSNKQIDSRNLSQALRLIDITGLVTLKYHVLELMAQVYEAAKKDREKDRVKKDIQYLTTSSSLEADQIKCRKPLLRSLPISLTL